MTTERERLAQRSGLRAKETTLRERVAAAAMQAFWDASSEPNGMHDPEVAWDAAADAAIRVVLAEAERVCSDASKRMCHLYRDHMRGDMPHHAVLVLAKRSMADELFLEVRALAGADSGKGESCPK